MQLAMLNMIFYIIIACWIGIISYPIANHQYHKGKVRVKEVQENGRFKAKWYKVDDTGKKILIKSTGGLGRADSKFEPEFSKEEVMYEGWVWKNPTVYVIPFAKKVINFRTGEVPPFSLDQLKEYSSKKLLSMQAKVRTQTQGILYLIALIVVIDTMFLFFLGNALGVVRLR